VARRAYVQEVVGAAPSTANELGRRAANGRIPIQAIIASIEADEAAATEGD
jgi:hypothetical protein